MQNTATTGVGPWRRRPGRQSPALAKGWTVVTVELQQWSEDQFAACALGDQRRTRRLVKLAGQMAANPDMLTPDQTETWGDCKAAYRLFECEQVTFDTVATPHWQRTRAQRGGTWLLINDTTTLNFGWHRQVEGLGPTGEGGQGFFLHSSLMVDPQTEAIVGLAGQQIFYRQPAPPGERQNARVKRPREIDVWGDLVEDIGSPPAETRFIHVCDAGADGFEVFGRMLFQRCDWIIRAAQLTRTVLYNDELIPLEDALKAMPLAGSYQLRVRGTRKRMARTAKLEVRFGTICLPAPKPRSRWVRETGVSLIGMNVVEVREIDAPRGAEPLHWVLYTSLPVRDFEDAWRVIEYYEKRPVIEEFHKGLKTGCSVEKRQFRKPQRLEAMTALLSVIAIRLLQMKTLARQNPTLPATDVVPARWVELLKLVRKGRPVSTVRDFFRQLAGLGGFLGRKHDGEPGWITLWRGFEKLQLMIRVTELQQECG